MISVNLLPWRQTRREQRRKKLKNGIGGAGILCVIFYFVFFQKNMTPDSTHFQRINKAIPVTRHKPSLLKPVSPLFSDDRRSAEEFIKVAHLRDLKWTGILIKQNQIQVFITAENGNTNLFSLGDEVGLEKAKIIAISLKHIILRNGNQKITWTRYPYGFSV